MACGMCLAKFMRIDEGTISAIMSHSICHFSTAGQRWPDNSHRYTFSLHREYKSGFHKTFPIRMRNYVIPEYCVWAIATKYRNQHMTGHAENLHEPIGRDNLVIT